MKQENRFFSKILTTFELQKYLTFNIKKNVTRLPGFYKIHA